MTRKKIALFAIPILATIMIVGTISPVFGGATLGETCNDQEFFCKLVGFTDADGDGIIEVGERVEFDVIVTVVNLSINTWTNTVVTDRFGAEINVSECTTPSPDTTVALPTKGKSNKVFLTWDIGTLLPGQSVRMICEANTDINPAGKQEYSSPGEYEFNSGAVLKFNVPDGSQRSFETGGISVEVECNENEEVDSKTGECVCKPGFEENPNGICISATG